MTNRPRKDKPRDKWYVEIDAPHILRKRPRRWEYKRQKNAEAKYLYLCFKYPNAYVTLSVRTWSISLYKTDTAFVSWWPETNYIKFQTPKN